VIGEIVLALAERLATLSHKEAQMLSFHIPFYSIKFGPALFHFFFTREMEGSKTRIHRAVCPGECQGGFPAFFLNKRSINAILSLFLSMCNMSDCWLFDSGDNECE
jgi:hypothetical protein